MNSKLSSVRAAAGRLGGMIGGKSTSAAKQAAARANGRMGGRPRKKPQFPKWVEDMNDPKGSDYLNGHVSSKPRTFGIKWYLEGVYEAFEGDIASFDVLIK